MSKKNNDFNLNQFIKGLSTIVCSVFEYIYHTFKEVKTLPRWALVNLALILILFCILPYRNTHFWLLHKYWPNFMTDNFARQIGMYPLAQLVSFLTLFFIAVIYVIGGKNMRRIKLVELAFKKSGLKNALGNYPVVKSIHNLTPFRQKIEIDSQGVPLSDFEKRKNNLRASANTQIESIIEQTNPQFLDLFLTSKSLSKKISYQNVSGKASKSGDFVVGETYGKVITQNLFELPHILVAGSTGMGKSYFLRQMILNIIGNTPNIQIFAIDLKQGVSMSPFKGYPNVKVIKDVSEAAITLEKIRDEMKERFSLLEKSGDEVIDFKKHNKDPILIVIDECSMLYAPVDSSDFTKKDADRATAVTDEVAKLSRAAGIHLALGTQKVVKETISTHIQENVEGRVCFKVSTIQGSTLVVGTKVAWDLPKVRGRAISKFSVNIDEIQTPFVDSAYIKLIGKKVTEEFKLKKRKFNQELISKINGTKIKSSRNINNAVSSNTGDNS